MKDNAIPLHTRSFSSLLKAFAGRISGDNEFKAGQMAAFITGAITIFELLRSVSDLDDEAANQRIGEIEMELKRYRSWITEMAGEKE